jgi:UDP-N-acetylmuramoylalanine--D-glutamate ligase
MEKMSNPVSFFAGMKVTIMGLGLNGGGLESARYLALNGAECTITDMKDETILKPSIEKLQVISRPHPPFRFVLGRHEMDDFARADMVIKNPGVRPDSPYLAAARRIETDLSLFLAASPARLITVTGSKGKSGTASAIHWVLSQVRGRAFLGGNITVSPLSFLDELSADDDVVLELSSWQLGDLKGRGLLKPRVAVFTSIMPDHQDRYGGMDAYVNDKRLMYRDQDRTDATVAYSDDHWGLSFLAESRGRPLPYSERPFSARQAEQWADSPRAWIDTETGAGMIQSAGGMGGINEAVPPRLLVPGRHNKKNCLAAALALFDLDIPLPLIHQALGTFTGIEHRLELFHEINGVRFYNDTTATIPEAAAAAVNAFTGESGAALILVCGGTDKNLDFSPLAEAAKKARDIILLSGTGSDKLQVLLKDAGIAFHGPFGSIDEAAGAAFERGQKAAAERGQKSVSGADFGAVVVVLSPGCTSFGMFKNEFDRGLRWKDAVRRLG